MTILIVEDDQTFAEFLASFLGKVGHQTHNAYDGLAALQVVEQHAVDLVLLDLGLPHMSGFEDCRQIRQNSNVPIVVLSARSQEQDRTLALQSGADHYLVKPCDSADLLVQISTILTRSQCRAVGDSSMDTFRRSLDWMTWREGSFRKPSRRR